MTQQSSRAPQCATVVEYLRRRMGTSRAHSRPPQPLPALTDAPAQPLVLATVSGRCPGPDTAHIPTQKSALAGGREYCLFAAARDGCLTCVQELVEVEHVNVFATSKTCKYTALDFAEWEVTQHSSRAPQCASVVAYLRRRMGASGQYGPPPPPLPHV